MFLTFLIGEEITVVPTKIDFARQTKNASAISWGGNSSVVKCPPPGWMVGCSIHSHSELAYRSLGKNALPSPELTKNQFPIEENRRI